MKQITFDFQETQVTAMAELYARVWGSEVEAAREKKLLVIKPILALKL